MRGIGRKFYTLLFVMLSIGVLARSQTDGATITGTVKDSAEAVLPGVAVVVTNADTRLYSLVPRNGELSDLLHSQLAGRQLHARGEPYRLRDLYADRYFAGCGPGDYSEHRHDSRSGIGDRDGDRARRNWITMRTPAKR